jgi:hypothetical protein
MVELKRAQDSHLSSFAGIALTDIQISSLLFHLIYYRLVYLKASA